MAGGSTITLDFPCSSCGTNLRGLAPEAACPKCQQPAANTLWAAIASGGNSSSAPSKADPAVGRYLRLRRSWLQEVAQSTGYPVPAVSLVADVMAHIRRRSLNAAGATISPREFCLSLRDYAVAHFHGVAPARRALGEWGVHSSDAIGRVVAALSGAGLLLHGPQQAKDFEGLFTLESLFSDQAGTSDGPAAGRLDGPVPIPLADDPPETDSAATTQSAIRDPQSAITRILGGSFHRQPMLYENAYVWLIFLSALDVMLTWIIVHRPDGYEANPLAAWILHNFGLPGMVVYKFLIIAFVVIVCEYVGRRNSALGMTFSRVAVGIACIPIVVAFTLLITQRAPVTFGVGELEVPARVQQSDVRSGAALRSAPA